MMKEKLAAREQESGLEKEKTSPVPVDYENIEGELYSDNTITQ